MSKIILVYLITFLISFSSVAQRQADNWYFGARAALNFSTGTPVAVSGSAISTNEGCSTVSDANGNLLFYTDGVSVWNRNNLVMPNGTGLMGGISATQSALIVPMPGTTAMYYIFTVDEIGGPNGFRYSVVDITLQGGLGDVTATKNILIQNNVCEKLTALAQQSGSKAWIAVHEWGSAAFYVYDLSVAGLGIPVISNTGIVHNNSAIQNTYGQMKFSPCGDKLVCAIGYQDTIEIFSFDEQTGIVSNPITLPIGEHVYGIEFSRNGSKLYVSNYNSLSTLVQFDLNAGNALAILASQVVLSQTPDIYALQMANNGKVYVCKSFSSSLGVINFPDSSGTTCNYQDIGVDLDPLFMGVTSALGLPGFVQSAFRTEPSCDPANGIDEFKDSGLRFKVYPNPVSEKLYVKSYTLNGDDAQIEIYNSMGERIHAVMLSEVEARTSVSVKKFPLGIYLLKISFDGKMFSEKIVVE